MTEVVRVLVVCTANICRSVMAETFLRLEGEERGVPIEVSSSGFLTNGDVASDVLIHHCPGSHCCPNERASKRRAKLVIFEHFQHFRNFR